MARPTPVGFLSRLRVVATIAPEPVAIVSEKPEGPVVALSDYRADMRKRRLDSVGTAGIWLDSGPTGVGKSTADLAAFKLAGRSLSIQPTHENCKAVVEDCLEAGIDAAAYPGRHSSGEHRNCWNSQADAAEAIGLCAVAAVCNAGCEHRRRCVDAGYLGAVAKASEARVAVCTHARATHTGLASLSEDRDYVVLHEDCLGTLCPQVSIPAASLELARTVLDRLLKNPECLWQFGLGCGMDEEGATIVSDKKGTERRSRRFEFCQHLANVVDRLISLASDSDSATEIHIGDPLNEAAGVQSVLFKICQVLGADFQDKPVWSLVFYVATGRFYRQGLLIHGRPNADDAQAGSDSQSDLFDATQSAESKGDCVVV